MFNFSRTDERDREGVRNRFPPTAQRTGRVGALVGLFNPWGSGARRDSPVPRRPRARLASFEEFRSELERSRRYDHSFVLVRFACGRADEGRFERSDRFASAVRSLVRGVDLVWAEGRNVYLLLPECGREMGEAALERICEPLAVLSSDAQRVELAWVVFPDEGLTSGALLDALSGHRAVGLDALPTVTNRGPTAVPEGDRQTDSSEMNPRVA